MMTSLKMRNYFESCCGFRNYNLLQFFCRYSFKHSADFTCSADSQLLLRMSDVIFSSLDARGNTPLHLATMQGHKEVVQLLAASGADTDLRDQVGYEPAHMAALHGHLNCLIILAAMGASINSKTDDRKLPLHLAAMRCVCIIY